MFQRSHRLYLRAVLSGCLLVGSLLVTASAGASAPGADDEAALNFGVIIQTFASPDVRPSGLGFDGENLWVVTDGPIPMLWKLDPTDGSVLDSMLAPVAESVLGLDHDGNALWGSTQVPEEVFSASSSDGSVISSFTSPMAAPTGIVWDGLDLWHAGTGADLQLLNKNDGSMIRSLPAPGQLAPRGMAWDGTTLWLVDAAGTNDDAIYQLDPATGAAKIVFVPAGDPLTWMSGLTYDGKYLWMSDLEDAEIHKVELGLHVALWSSGSCPGQVRVRVQGETPNGRYVVAHGKSLDGFEIPSGECEGIPLEVGTIADAFEVTTDESAEFILTGNVGEAICGDYLQVIDLDTCLKSFVGRVPFE